MVGPVQRHAPLVADPKEKSLILGREGPANAELTAAVGPRIVGRVEDRGRIGPSDQSILFTGRPVDTLAAGPAFAESDPLPRVLEDAVTQAGQRVLFALRYLSQLSLDDNELCLTGLLGDPIDPSEFSGRRISGWPRRTSVGVEPASGR